MSCEGQLSVEVRGPNGNIPVEVIMKDKDLFAISFIPRQEG